MSSGGSVANGGSAATSAERERRRDAVEALRVPAACGVVWFHIPGGPWKDAGYAGLLCFVMISAFFLTGGARKQSAGVFFRKRILRVIAPWAFWMIAYGILNLVRGKELFPAAEGWVADLLTGTWIGLWYLPFVLAMAALVFALAKPAAALPAGAGAALWLLSGLAALCLLPGIDAGWAGKAPWAQWLHALPAVFLGMSLHETMRLPRAWRAGFALATALAVLATAVWLWREHRGVSVTYGLAIVPVCAAFLAEVRLPRVLVAAGSLCLGVYLVHAAFVGGLRMFPVFHNSPLLLFPMVVILSFAATEVLRRCRFTKPVV